MKDFVFEKGDIVQAKIEWLDSGEKQEDTVGIVVEYNENNDRMKIGVLNPQDYAIPPTFIVCGCYYELVKRN